MGPLALKSHWLCGSRSCEFCPTSLWHLGYIAETQDPNHVYPVDFDEGQYGLALFLNEITVEMIESCEGVEGK